MAISKFDDIKDILLNNDIEILSVIESDLICGICQNLSKEPYATICGCTHCRSCIQNYLNEGERCCPGEKLECKECFVDQNTNIYFDPKTNIRIGKLIAKCPNKLCNFETTLDEMKQHFRTCHDKKSYCPYFSVGCNDNKITLLSVNEHIQQNSVNHAYMLVEHVNNTRNDIDSLIRNYEKKMTNQQAEVEELNRELSKNRNSFISQQPNFVDKNLIFNNGLFKLFYTLDKNIRLPNIILLLVVLMLASYVSYVQRSHQDQVDRLLLLIENIDNYDYGEHLWRISNYSQKVDEAKIGKRVMIESGVFFSHKYGYKLRLQMFPNGIDFHKSTHLSLRLVMLAGPYDDLHQWPFSKGVKINFVNQVTGKQIASSYVHSNGYTYPSLRRVVGEKSDTGMDVRYDLGHLESEKGFVKDDTVFVYCSVKRAL